MIALVIATGLLFGSIAIFLMAWAERYVAAVSELLSLGLLFALYHFGEPRFFFVEIGLLLAGGMSGIVLLLRRRWFSGIVFGSVALFVGIRLLIPMLGLQTDWSIIFETVRIFADLSVVFSGLIFPLIAISIVNAFVDPQDQPIDREETA